MRLSEFPASFLAEDEDLVLDLRPHWLSLVVPILQAAAMVAAVIIALLYVPYSWGTWTYGVILIAGLVALAVWPARPIVAWATSHFVVTTDRVIRRSGLLARQWVEISLERITDVRFRETVLERLIRAGDVIIESAGSLGPVVFENVRRPDGVQKVIFEMKEAQKRKRPGLQHGGMDGSPWAASVADEIEKLHYLRERGAITETEFQALKARLVSRG